MDFKKCGHCKEVKDTSNFWKKRETELTSWCKECYKVYQRKREFMCRLKYRFGMTVPQYENLVKEQEGKCALCGRKKKLFIDHDHTTGRVRGLICRGCNSGLGFFEDNQEFLSKAIIYLKKNGSND